MNKMKVIFTVLAGLGLCTSSLDASVKALGIGNAQVAYPQEPTNAAYNPAIITDLCDSFEIGPLWLHREGTLRVTGNAVPGMNGRDNVFTHPDIPAIEGGIVFRLPQCDLFCGSFSAGFILYEDVISKTKHNKIFPAAGTSHLGIEALGINLGPVFAWQINECHSIGISIPFAINRFKQDGVEFFRFLSVEPDHVSNREYQYFWGVGPVIGWLGHITPQLSLGASYRIPAHMSKIRKYDGLLAGHGAARFPARYKAGIRYNLDCFNFALDFTYESFRHIKALHNSQFSTGLIGSNKGPGWGWKYEWSIGGGVDWAVSDCLTLRAGYIYSKPPTRKSQTGFNATYCFVVRDTVTVGATWQPCCDLELSFAWEHGFRRWIRGAPLSAPITIGGGRADLREQRDIVGINVVKYF